MPQSKFLALMFFCLASSLSALAETPPATVPVCAIWQWNSGPRLDYVFSEFETCSEDFLIQYTGTLCKHERKDYLMVQSYVAPNATSDEVIRQMDYDLTHLHH